MPACASASAATSPGTPGGTCPRRVDRRGAPGHARAAPALHRGHPLVCNRRMRHDDEQLQQKIAAGEPARGKTRREEPENPVPLFFRCVSRRLHTAPHRPIRPFINPFPATAGVIPPTRELAGNVPRRNTQLIDFQIIVCIFYPREMFGCSFFYLHLFHAAAPAERRCGVSERDSSAWKMCKQLIFRELYGDRRPRGDVRREKNPPVQTPRPPKPKIRCHDRPTGPGMSCALPTSGSFRPRRPCCTSASRPSSPNAWSGAATAGPLLQVREAALHNYIFVRTTKRVIDELKTFRLPMLQAM